MGGKNKHPPSEKAKDIFDVVEMFEYISEGKNLIYNDNNNDYYNFDNDLKINLLDVFILIQNIVNGAT